MSNVTSFRTVLVRCCVCCLMASAVDACSSGPTQFASGTGPGFDAGAPADGDSGGTNIEGGVDGGSDGGDASLDAHDAGADADASTNPEPSVCALSMQAGASTKLGASTNLDDNLGTVTHDELSIAWVTESNGSTVLHVADRAQVGDAFGADAIVAGTFANDRVVLSADGLVLYAVSADRKSILRFERGTRSEAFVGTEATEMANVVAALGANELLGDPVLAYGGLALFYSVYGGGSSDTVRIATRIGNQSLFDVAGPVALTELRAQNLQRRRPTGMSSDDRMLFFFDEVSQTQKMALLKGMAFGIWGVTDLGARRFAQPNADCSKLYFTAGSNGRDIFSAPLTP